MRAAAGAAALAVGGFAWAYATDTLTFGLNRAREDGADLVEARLDALALRVDHSFPGIGCDYSPAGWSSPTELFARVAGSVDAVLDVVEETSVLGGAGLVRLHFTLPRTADLATIDVRAVRVRVDPRDAGPPQWSLDPDGCGGGQYRRTYFVRIEGGRASEARVSEDGELTQEAFEPFSVTPGETVSLDYRLVLCDARTYELAFDVEYVADSGSSADLRVPADEPLVMTGLPAEQRYMATQNEIQGLPAGGDTAQPFSCG